MLWKAILFGLANTCVVYSDYKWRFSDVGKVSVWPNRPLVDQVLAVGSATDAQFQGSSSSARLIL